MLNVSFQGKKNGVFKGKEGSAGVSHQFTREEKLKLSFRVEIERYPSGT